MKYEFWAEFDLYGKIAPFGPEIVRLLEEERRARREERKAREELQNARGAEEREAKEREWKKKKRVYEEKRQNRMQKQEEVQILINTFMQNGTFNSHFVADEALRQLMLAQLLPADVTCEGSSTQCKDYAKGKNGLQWRYYCDDLRHPRGDFQEFLCRRMRWMASILGLVNQEITVAPALPDLSRFPPGTWAVQVTFTLCKPYISKDDVDFYILDNPVKKEHVFKIPYVAPSQWKGALRAAMVRELVMAFGEGKVNEDEFVEKRLQMYRLFGNEKDGTAEFLNRTLARFRVGPPPQEDGEEATRQWRERLERETKVVAEEFESVLRENGYRVGDIEGFQGRLHFYPTFFDKIGLEVINPHDRKTGAGKHPIYFECVPAGTKGCFTLLYVPLDGGPADEATCKADLEAVAQGIRAMLTKYGFGAKTSSGYGVAEIEYFHTETQRTQG